MQLIYERPWADNVDRAEVEMSMIQKGGYKGNLLPHYLALRKLLWPKRLTCSWTELIYREILKNQMTILMGCASSWKTSTASEYVLLDYWCFPESTAVLVSTTTREKLEDAIFGEIKMLFNEGKKLRPWLAGNILDYKQAILTEDLEGDGVRDLRKGLKGKALYVGQNYVGLGCFPEGQMVETRFGFTPIEEIKVGDEIIGALGPSRVKYHSIRTAESLVRIHLSNGGIVDCTPEHPILTELGWEKAIDITSESKVFSTHETMQIMRCELGKRAETILFSQVSNGDVEKTMSLVRNSVHSVRGESDFLFSVLCRDLENDATRNCGQNERQSGCGSDFERTSPILDSETTGTIQRANEKNVSDAPIETKTRNSVQWQIFDNTGRIDSESDFSKCQNQFHDHYRQEFQTRQDGPSLSNGFGLAKPETGCRSGWALSRHTGAKDKGPSEGQLYAEVRVVRVEILQPASDPRYDESKRGYRVHNLEIEGHPSYSVNGIVVHNSFAGIKQHRIRFVCDELQWLPSTFLDCLPNMFSNPDVKVIGSGNPNHDPDSQLAIAAEPKDGWASVEHIEETSVWDTAFYKSRCVNLIGTDSDNFKAPRDKPEPFPRLIGPRFAEKIAHDYGENSPQYETQVKGRMKLSLAEARVITRQLCREHHAHDKVIWSGKPLMKIHACDPAYGGGDRCISGHIEIGEDVNGKVIVRVPPPHIIKIDLRLPITPEDQIAKAVKKELDEKDIPPDHSGYDSFGKGTVGFAFSRMFGSNCPVPIDSGGRPTKRAVRQDLYITEESNRGRTEKRLKRCDEHYSKFVTEMWFSVRYVIESDQMRELPTDVMEEGCSREYTVVEGNKIEVEPKDEMRLRKNKSPDLFDWLALAVEMARRRGFVIARLGNEEEGEDSTWLEDLRDRQKRLRKDWILTSH